MCELFAEVGKDLNTYWVLTASLDPHQCFLKTEKNIYWPPTVSAMCQKPSYELVEYKQILGLSGLLLSRKLAGDRAMTGTEQSPHWPVQLPHVALSMLIQVCISQLF